MTNEGSAQSHCVVIVDVVECRDLKDGGECVVRFERENVVRDSEASCHGMTCVGRLVVWSTCSAVCWLISRLESTLCGV